MENWDPNLPPDLFEVGVIEEVASYETLESVKDVDHTPIKAKEDEEVEVYSNEAKNENETEVETEAKTDPTMTASKAKTKAANELKMKGRHESLLDYFVGFLF